MHPLRGRGAGFFRSVATTRNGRDAVFSKGLSDEARKRIELAIAVAQEKLLAAHVDHALDLIALVNEDVSFTNALEIYTRLLRLDEDESQNIRTRALAILGEKAEETRELPREPEPRVREDARDRPGRGFFGQIKQRLRGRENEELRRKIEFIAARTEVALVRTHVDNALHFVDFLKDEVDEREGVELYLDALDVRESIAEVTYYLALSRLADEHLPPHGSGIAAEAREDAGLPGHEEAAGRLHALD